MNTIDVPIGSGITYGTDHPYSEYLKAVKRYNFFYRISHTSLSIFQGFEPSDLDKYGPEETSKIADRSGHSLGGIYRATKLKCKGTLVLLPPPTEISIERAIDRLLEIFGKPIIKEIPPSWVFDLPFHRVVKISKEIYKLEHQREILRRKIISEKNKAELSKKHYRLLYETGSELEDAVYEAFKILGFHEIKKIRENDKEDWVFSFKNSKDRVYGVIEVKGVEKQISKNNIQQCEGWVTDYSNSKKRAKGILIANQFRLRP